MDEPMTNVERIGLDNARKSFAKWAADGVCESPGDDPRLLLDDYGDGDSPAHDYLFRLGLMYSIGDLLEKILPFSRATESPVEKLLLYAMWTAGTAGGVCNVEFRTESMAAKFGGAAPFNLICQVQPRIAKYRVDFLIQHFFWEDPPPRPLVVECDGHDFHEKTKEQARKDKQRDRAIQAMGYPILRFTGSEVFADPFACVQEIIKFPRQEG